MNPLRISAEEMHALAVFCILEGDASLANVHEQLKVAAVIVNRTNSRNWVAQYGPSLLKQMFAKGQFEVQTRYGLKQSQFGTRASAARALAAAKRGLDAGRALKLIEAFIAGAGAPAEYGRAARAVGNATGFRSRSGGNAFRKESPYDEPNLQAKQPSNIVIR